MAWQIAHPADLPGLISFLSVREWGHVAFSSRLMKKGHPDLPNDGATRIYVNSGEAGQAVVREALLLAKGGAVVPALRGAGLPAERRDDLVGLFAGRAQRVYSVMGTRAGVQCIQSAIGRQPSACVDYDMLAREGGWTTGPANTHGLTYRRAGPQDASRLFPLQRDYEKEEVLLDPSSFDSRLSYRHLQKSLAEQTVYFATEGKRVVAKAGTNAVGISYAQIGGVFTIHEMRNRGIAGELMRVLILDLEKTDRHPCLFVKKDNRPAKSLYESLGFTYRDDFQIAYFRS